MGHLTVRQVKALAAADWACRYCHAWIAKDGPFTVRPHRVRCSDGMAIFGGRYHRQCARDVIVLGAA